MKIIQNNYSISELREMFDAKALIINKNYQRNSGLWPNSARAYFIDTIISEYPFPKLYFREFIDNQKTRREVVDGQQRLTSIIDFLNNRFKVKSLGFADALYFSELSADDQDNFLSYSVEVDVLRGAKDNEILEMFRRMNSYTLPLNQAEKRHSSYQGEFKWFINALCSKFSEFLSNFDVLTKRQMVRMQDAELFTDLTLAIQQGIVSTSPKFLNSLYKDNDVAFADKISIEQKISESIDFIITRFPNLRKTFMMKPYALHTLCSCLIFRKWGYPTSTPAVLEDCSLDVGNFCSNAEQSEALLLQIAGAHEAGETEGALAEYVIACAGGTNRAPRREIRAKYILDALEGYLAAT